MTIETDLARLTAGLAEDEAAAQEALSLEEPYRKLSDEGISVAIRYEWVRHTKLSTGGRGSMFLDGAPDPRRVLCQAEAIRQVIEESQRYVGRESSETGDVGYEEYVSGHTHACERILSMLAGIYTEPTEEPRDLADPGADEWLERGAAEADRDAIPAEPTEEKP